MVGGRVVGGGLVHGGGVVRGGLVGGRLVCRGGVRCGVVGRRVVRGGLVRGRVGLVDGLALVPDVGDVAVLVVGVVGDDLGAAVGEGDAVLAADDAVLVLRLLLVEVGAGVLVLDAVLVGEGARGQLVGVGVVLGRRVVRGCIG